MIWFWKKENWLWRCWRDGVVIRKIFNLSFSDFLRVSLPIAEEYFKKRYKKKETYGHFFESSTNEKLNEIKQDLKFLVEKIEEGKEHLNSYRREHLEKKIIWSLAFFRAVQKDIDYEIILRTDSKNSIAEVLSYLWQPRLIKKAKKKLKPSVLKRIFRFLFSRD